jgi:hypothetical protein
VKKLLAVVILLTGIFAAPADAQTQEIMEEPDPALGVTLFVPKKITPADVEKARFNLGHVRFRVYPVLYQKLDKSEKAAIMQIDILGLYKGFSNASLVVTIDGQPVTLPNLRWVATTDGALSTKVALLDSTGSFGRIAAAKDVYLTVLLPGWAPDRYTVHLVAENLDVFKTMRSKYDTLDAQPKSAAPAPTIAAATSIQQPSAPQAVVTNQDQDVAAASRAVKIKRESEVQVSAQANPVPPASESKQQQEQPLVNASAKSVKPAAQPAGKKTVEVINDAFAKAALRALKAVQGDATTPEVTQGGDILFSKQVVDAIDAADSEARTSAETALSSALSALHIQRSTNNITLAAAEEGAKASHRYESSGDLAREMETRDMLRKDRHIAELKNSPAFLNANACAAGLETLFRARKSGPIPSECSASSK